MAERRQDSIRKSIAHYASSRIYQQVLGLVTAFLRPKLLTPEQFGLWTLFKIVPRYAYYAHLGTGTALRYLVPYYEEKGDERRVDSLERSSFSAGFALNLLFGLALFVCYLRQGFSPEVRAGFLCMSGLVVLQFLREYYLIYFKAHERFSMVASSNYVFITVAFVLTVPLLYFLKLYGVFLSVLSAELVAVGYMRIRFGRPTVWGFEKDAVKELLLRGSPLMLFDAAVVCIMTVDRVIVAALLGNEQLGYYGIAVLAMGSLLHIPAVAREVIEPRAMRASASASSETLVTEYLLKPLVNTAYSMPLLIGPAYLALPPFITLFLPKHMAGIAPAQILVCSVFFLALAYVPRMVIAAGNWQAQSLIVMPWALVLNVGLSVWLIRLGYGLPGVAVSSALSYLLLLALLLIFVRRKHAGAGAVWSRNLWASAAPMCVACGVLALLHYGLPFVSTNLYVQTALGIPLFLAAYGGFRALARRRLSLLESILP